MSLFTLMVLIGSAFGLQYWLDLREIAERARSNGWSSTRIVWAPFSAGWLARNRWTRSYWLSYRDRNGRPERRLCLIENFMGLGEGSIDFERVVGDARSSAVAAPRSRIATIMAWTGGGVFVGMALGIGACLVIYPTSNVAPAYGVIVGAPAGLVVGAVIGILRAR